MRHFLKPAADTGFWRGGPARLQKKAALFLCVSNFIREQAMNGEFRPEKLVVHHLGIDAAKLVPEAGQGREPVVLLVGRLAEKKGLDDLLRAMGRNARKLSGGEAGGDRRRTAARAT